MTRLALSLLAVCFALAGSGLVVHSAPTFPGEADLISALPGLKYKTNFKHYSGYLESLNGNFLHYWFFESQSAHPEKDPVVLWLNGGPGCSSMLGALSELGPIRLNRDGSLSNNPHAWNQKANILFLESPAGVGFSYKADGQYKQDDTSTALLNFDALRSFFKKFPHLAENPFFLTGESYAGIYIPTLSLQLLEHKFPKNFKGVAIGNGYLDVTLLGNSVLHFYYYHGLMGSTDWDHLVKACCHTTDLRHCDFVNNKEHACVAARISASRHAQQARINHYDIYGECRHDPSHGPTPTPGHHNASAPWGTPVSYEATMDKLLMDSLNLNEEQFYAAGHSPPCLSQDYLAKFLNQPEVRKAMHISEKAWEWGPCRSNIGYHRELKSMKTQIKHMVDAGVKVLIYNGDTDSVCNFIGDEWFVEELGYRTRIDYHPWVHDNQVAGFTKFYDHQLTFVTVRGAGHMVPEDKPGPALKMFHDFLGVH